VPVIDTTDGLEVSKRAFAYRSPPTADEPGALVGSNVLFPGEADVLEAAEAADSWISAICSTVLTTVTKSSV
jgi:hypothetical protein